MTATDEISHTIPSTENPFDSRDARTHSGLYSVENGKLQPGHSGKKPTSLANFIHDTFRALILNPQFVCAAAKSAFNHNNYQFGVYESEMGSSEATQGLAYDLAEFTREQDETLRDNGFSTFIACFTGPAIAVEDQFEYLLWRQLQRLHDEDARFHGWDASVSSDPDAPDFEFSFAERAFFVVGMHPANTRWTRRFAWPTLVFNAHFQFEELRTQGKYGKMQTVIRDRDIALQGSVNANLADFGDRSDARQYSGRPVEENWKCPFQAKVSRN